MRYEEVPEWATYTAGNVREALEVCQKKMSKTGILAQEAAIAAALASGMAPPVFGRKGRSSGGVAGGRGSRGRGRGREGGAGGGGGGGGGRVSRGRGRGRRGRPPKSAYYAAAGPPPLPRYGATASGISVDTGAAEEADLEEDVVDMVRPLVGPEDEEDEEDEEGEGDEEEEGDGGTKKRRGRKEDAVRK